MATPTRANLETTWRNVVDLLEEARKFGEENSKNIIAMLDTVEQSIEMDFAADFTGALGAFRRAAAGGISPAVAAAMLRPILRQYAKSVIGRGNIANDQDIFSELYKFYDDNNLRVQSRVFSFNDPVAEGDNTGNIQIARLNVDDRNFDIENQHVDSKRAICVRDHVTGTEKGNEVWQIRGQTAARDDLERSGSGLEGQLLGQTADDSLLNNATFSQFGGTAAAPTDITSWTSTITVSATNFEFDSTNFFRSAPSDATGSSFALRIKNSVNLTQRLSVRRSKLDPNRPYLLAVAWNREIQTASGTLNLRVGDVTTQIAVSGQTGWQVTLVPNPIGQSAWYKNLAQDDLEIGLEWIQTTGDLYVDDFLLVGGTRFDNSWYWVLPATAATYIAPRRLDEFNWADSAIEGKIQKWNWRAFNRYLPHSDGSSITHADP